MGGTVTDQTNNVYPIKHGRGSDSNGGNGSHGERLARIEARLEHMATKEDIQKIKVWVLSGILGGVGVTITIMKFFSSP